MPRYFFHVLDGSGLRDHDGTDLSDQKDARVQAVRMAGAMIKDDAKSFLVTQEWHMDVADEADLVLFSLHFRVTSRSASQ